MKRSLKVGCFVGILAGVAGIVTAYLIGMFTALWFDQLTWISIGIASIVTNMAGALIYSGWFQSAKRSRIYYIVLVSGVTLLMTVNDIVNPPSIDFGIVAHPVHIVVALISIWLIPKWLKPIKTVRT
ncbi:hypothetical protein [Virgibacillus salinus]|uniref:Uncharacterized protein n=1 Tax=Virgibacillus salinus TaxID=553311 RepID=A0A1H1DVM6_9BACI|nr:hypothetical protein [Virgibacillus salinus]SDQ80535.1 hypothetical protein SAMN05216231_2599 [Virgibacillus salinus]